MSSAIQPLSSSERGDPSIVSQQRLSTSTVPEKERADYWIDLICSLYVQLDLEAPTDDAIFGDVEFNRIGTLDFTHLRSNGRRVRRTPERIRQGGGDYFLVIIQREGRGALIQGGRTAFLNPGDFVLGDCTRPYELVFDGPYHDVYVLRFLRKQLMTHVGNLDDLCATTLSGGNAVGHLLLSMIDSVRRDLAELHPASALGVSEAITNVIGAGLRTLPGANQRNPSNLAAYHLARIRAHVQSHLSDPALSLASIAHAVNLSSDHICRLFRNEPLPLSRQIWQQRLEACRRDLADPRLQGRSVSEIAFSWGFNDAAHFSRSFREQFGLSPRQWRTEQRSLGCVS
ncbi:MAG: helix-turn-helix domain-containing protein [Gammaproteobacteria bacterium]|nr:helix-turn-helix domain-containing protein [Gammaproteobacteria bacterium]MBU1444514.1 helix-turn-helix domain-containing protein [Gammaproteobacteria bacterium]MBU2287761.1 helix-turn-helix domain-containing protein [Gammaproteobacteria bacterium]MBU2410699.1 helix-turn-helix domain-containing protein [Gammaproteobacteria bacterium]